MADDALCLDLLMNSNKHKRKNKPADTNTDDLFKKRFKKALESVEPTIFTNPTILSNFDVFLQRLLDNITRFVDDFDKNVLGKLD